MSLSGVTAGILTSGLTPLFIRSMRTGARHWRARGHRETTWSFSKVFFKFPKCFVSRLFQFFFSCHGFLTDICDGTCELIQPRVWLNVLLLFYRHGYHVPPFAVTSGLLKVIFEMEEEEKEQYAWRDITYTILMYMLENNIIYIIYIHGNVSVKSKLQHPPEATPRGIWLF